MNERIQSLAEQAGMYVDLNGKPWPKSMSAGECEVAYAKFAQLIVRECASRVDWIYAEKGQTIDGVDFTVTQGDLIRQHFGVEE